jgi:hypothetical protein
MWIRAHRTSGLGMTALVVALCQASIGAERTERGAPHRVGRWLPRGAIGIGGSGRS